MKSCLIEHHGKGKTRLAPSISQLQGAFFLPPHPATMGNWLHLQSWRNAYSTQRPLGGCSPRTSWQNNNHPGLIHWPIKGQLFQCLLSTTTTTITDPHFFLLWSLVEGSNKNNTSVMGFSTTFTNGPSPHRTPQPLELLCTAKSF